jgi:hypothetical protein
MKTPVRRLCPGLFNHDSLILSVLSAEGDSQDVV